MGLSKYTVNFKMKFEEKLKKEQIYIYKMHMIVYTVHEGRTIQLHVLPWLP